MLGPVAPSCGVHDELYAKALVLDDGGQTWAMLCLDLVGLSLAFSDELRALMEIGLDFNVRFQEAQMERIGGFADGCFIWVGEWLPFPRAISLSVDAYVICSPEHYVAFGFDYQRRLIEHFGKGVVHFHCNRADLAAEVARLPGVVLFQFGGDTRDPVPEIDRLPEMRRAVGDIPIMVSCELRQFKARLKNGTLPPNVWYAVHGGPLSVDEANRLMDDVRLYRVRGS